MVDQPTTDLNTLAAISVPSNRQPSKTYLQCLVKGAIETGIESWYIEWMKNIKHNDNIVEYLEDILELKDVQL